MGEGGGQATMGSSFSKPPTAVLYCPGVGEEKFLMQKNKIKSVVDYFVIAGLARCLLPLRFLASVGNLTAFRGSKDSGFYTVHASKSSSVFCFCFLI